MKKSKLTLGITVAAMSCALLAGCNEVTYSPEGYLLTYTGADGEVKHYTAEDLFGSYLKDSGKVSTMFDSIYKLIVRNYFNSESQKGTYEQIKINAQNDVDGVKSKAKENQKTNDSKYDDEWEKLLESYSCKDEEELLEHFIYERELEEFNDQFYKNHITELRDNTLEDNNYSGYLEKKVPYHVRHILVKVEDSGSTNYWNATIDKKDAIDLYDVVSNLANGENTFGKVAQLYSEDSSSTSFGELDIVDRDTEYVPEFKLGMYAFENLYHNATISQLAGASNIAMSEEVIDRYAAATGTDIGRIPYGAFAKLKDVNDVTKDAHGRDVNEGNANYYPRNVYFNNYLNEHFISVITPERVDGSPTADPAGLARFATSTDDNLGKVLRTEKGQPIFVVRAGTSSYQGIHFIVIERSGLVEEQDDVTLSEYYTTKRPSEDGYPKKDGEPKQTYVNYLAQSEAEYKTRAEKVEGKIKNFDSNLNKYIYRLNVANQNIKFTDAGKPIAEAIDKWIDTTLKKALFDEAINWEKTWDSYLDSLEVAKDEKSKVLSTGCAIGFQDHDETPAINTQTGGEAEWQLGGACYDNKE